MAAIVLTLGAPMPTSTARPPWPGSWRTRPPAAWSGPCSGSGGDTAAGLLLIILHGLRIVSTAALVAVPTALFLAVYLGAMAAARGFPARCGSPPCRPC